MQSKRGSFVESLSNTAVGFIVSMLTWEFLVKPLWGLTTTLADNLGITLLFTVISVLRGYVLRRVFNWSQKKNKNDQADRNYGPRPGGQGHPS